MLFTMHGRFGCVRMDGNCKVRVEKTVEIVENDFELFEKGVFLRAHSENNFLKLSDHYKRSFILTIVHQ